MIKKGWIFAVKDIDGRVTPGRWVVVREENAGFPGKCKVVLSRTGERYDRTHIEYDFNTMKGVIVDEAATIAYWLFPELLV